MAAAHSAQDATHPNGFQKARAGAIVVLDAQSGAVVAMASAPSYDPTKFTQGITPEDWASLNASGSGYPMNARAISASYPPGSTFKAVTGMAALQGRRSTAPGSGTAGRERPGNGAGTTPVTG